MAERVFQYTQSASSVPGNSIAPLAQIRDISAQSDNNSGLCSVVCRGSRTRFDFGSPAGSVCAVWLTWCNRPQDIRPFQRKS